jgi:hypothetical protein
MRVAIEPVRAEPMMRMVVMEGREHGPISNEKAPRRQPGRGIEGFVRLANEGVGEQEAGHERV